MIPRHKGPRRRRWRELREKRGRGIVLLPSLLTTGNLFCGFFALLLTVEGRFTDAALAIFVAMVMDLLDGRVARLMKATSQFGVEFDSLVETMSALPLCPRPPGAPSRRILGLNGLMPCVGLSMRSMK